MGATPCSSIPRHDLIVPPGAELGDFVWYDANSNGIQDEGPDSGISGVRLELWWDSDNNGSKETFLRATTTGDTGFYAFGNYLFGLLGAGTYEVRVDASTLPGGLAQTYDLDDGTGPFASPNAATATLRLAERRLDVDFGYVGGGGQSNALGDKVWYDVNGNGIQDAGEPGIDGVVVNLAGDIDGDGVAEIHLTTTTGSPAGPDHGVYSFTNLPNGSYTVTVDPGNFGPGGALEGYLPTAPLAGLNRTVDSNGSPTTAALPEAIDQQGDGLETDLTLDFGFVGTGAIGNYVWIDENNDGYQDAGEPGLPNVTVQLKNAQGVVLATTRTDAQGGYLFPNLAPGAYTVQVDAGTLPAGLTQTTNPVLGWRRFRQPEPALHDRARTSARRT